MEPLRTPRGVRIAPSAIKYEFARSGGPGGQHVNTSATKATVILDVEQGLSPSLARKLLERQGATMRATSSVHRSQWKNRNAAMTRLLRRIDEALEDQPERRSTAVPRSQKRKRRTNKERRSQRLAERKVDPE